MQNEAFRSNKQLNKWNERARSKQLYLNGA